MNLSKVKYICLSDLHFGADSGLFTDDSSDSGGTSAALRRAFSDALNSTLTALADPKPPDQSISLVLLGDILDLSLGTPKKSIKSFRDFLNALAGAGVQKWLGPFIFLPGNHDHELWTASRLQHLAVSSSETSDYDHTTPAFVAPGDQPKAAILDKVLSDCGFAGATTYYPNMGLASPDGSRMVILHHGHFVESIYRTMSTLTGLVNGTAAFPENVEILEKLNSSWIDFVWSTDGDDGELGADIRLGYDYLLTGREDIRFDHRLAHQMADRLTKQLPLPQTAKTRMITQALSKAAIDSLLGEYGQMERLSYFQLLGADALEGMKSYLAGPVLRQIAQEKAGAKPKDLTFIFGHTHKPFQSRLPVPGIAGVPAIYNTGGWDLDMPMFGTRLGAAAVFIDEELNVASLRLCQVPDQDGPSADPKIPPVSIATADGTSDGNPLAQQLQAAVAKAQTSWTTFSAAADAAYRSKQQLILSRLQEADERDRKSRRVL